MSFVHCWSHPQAFWDFLTRPIFGAGMLPSLSLFDERLAFAVQGFLLCHKLAALLGPRLDLFCTSLVLKLQVIAIFLHLFKVHFVIFLHSYKVLC
jgi:hypothetical protein